MKATLESTLAGLGIDTTGVRAVLQLMDPARLLSLTADMLSRLTKSISNLVVVLVENVAKPKFLGESLDIAPVVIILSLIFWTAVLGPMGALLAVPLTMAIKQLILETDEEARWLAELMSAADDDDESAGNQVTASETGSEEE